MGKKGRVGHRDHPDRWDHRGSLDLRVHRDRQVLEAKTGQTESVDRWVRWDIKGRWVQLDRWDFQAYLEYKGQRVSVVIRDRLDLKGLKDRWVHLVHRE